jgi:hypothetical protein
MHVYKEKADWRPGNFNARIVAKPWRLKCTYIKKTLIGDFNASRPR